MTRSTWSYGKRGRAMAVPGHGGWSDVAHDLSRQPPHVTVTRQTVYSWWKHREGNGCPDRHVVERGGISLLQFKIEEMRLWYAQRNGYLDAYLNELLDNEEVDPDEQAAIERSLPPDALVRRPA